MKNMWAAFDSVTSTKEALQEISKEKIVMPSFDESELNDLENKIILAYYTDNKIKLKYYQDNSLKEILTNIKKIDSVHKTITLANHTTILFGQIIEIN